MDTRLNEALSGRTGNVMLPFLWMHSGKRAKLPALVQSIYDSGCRAFCVESRPHEHFCEDEWWGDMQVLIDEARARDMKVWILDDRHFPTGYANGAAKDKHPELRSWQLIDDHTDVRGPMRNARFIAPAETPDNTLVAAVACPLRPFSVEIGDEGIDLTDKVNDGVLTWDVPEGAWRVFFLSKSRRGVDEGHKNYIDMIRPEAVDLLINEVYETHFAHFSRYFGNTIAGFFSDEPCFGNGYGKLDVPQPGFYDNKIGTPGMALPWSDEVLPLMRKELNYDPIPYLGCLWYASPRHSELRTAYMHAVTELWLKNFSYRLGSWCRAHKVEYIGHIIEDNNCHARLRSSAGHYFRALDGQDMGGIDVVLHQLMPGFADFPHTAYASPGRVNTGFFHYVLAKLASSHAHLNPRMRNRAMCETFGAYGWAEGTDLMKWMLDHLMVRGINRFVPHAFDPDFPDPDCPPHFNADGHNPQFEAFSAVMNYAQKTAHILGDGAHIASCALLYHAEAEWSGEDYVPMEVPARLMYENQIDYDIVPADYLISRAKVENSRLCLENGETRDVLVSGGCRFLPAELISRLKEFAAQGLKIVFTDYAPADVGLTVPASELVTTLDRLCTHDRVHFEPAYRHLSVFHVKRDGHDVFMLVNEDTADICRGTLTLPVTGSYAFVQLQLDSVSRGCTKDGRLSIELAPYESALLVFDGADTEISEPYYTGTRMELTPAWEVSAADTDNLSAFKPVISGITASDAATFASLMGTGFSGKLRCACKMELPKGATALDFGDPGAPGELRINGQRAGVRMCTPQVYDIRRLVRDGENTIEFTLSNTLSNRIPDQFSSFMATRDPDVGGAVTVISK